MSQVDFYQLGESPLEHVLARVAERVLAGGGRLLVVSEDEGQLARLDAQLWTYAPGSFLPHGRSGDAAGPEQPVLLSGTADAVNGARNLAIVDGRWREEALGFDRTFHFFDEASVEAARGAWRGLAGLGEVTRAFWRQAEGGSWTKIA